MSCYTYVNDRYLRIGAAAAPSTTVPSFSATESTRVRGSAPIDVTRHLARLSLAALRISWPIGATAVRAVVRENVWRNRALRGAFYSVAGRS
jgi:branched-subunit amino acid aminotransferase/4-amino-4-deoxychorismate lyase